jgi:ubiquinone/menaquinone biosynthesis C-methylase UbiE
MTFSVVRRVVMIGLVLAGTFALFRQCRRPSGWLGRRIARAMNIGHAALTKWGLGHVEVQSGWRILDIGCGGGQTMRTLAELASAGRVSGVDYSPTSVETSRAVNAGLIQSGRADVQQASVSKLPFDDASFDLVTAVETHYYWPDLAQDLREVRRVLKPGGRFLLIAETYKGRSMDWIFRPVMRILLQSTYLSLDEHREAFIEAGFTDVEIDAIPARGWMSGLGTRET